MTSNEFFEILDKTIPKMSQKELLELIQNMARKIPANKYPEVMTFLEKGNDTLEEITKKITNYKKEFAEIENLEKTFYSTMGEEYYDYYGMPDWEYYDKDKIGEFLTEVYQYATDLLLQKHYEPAKELLYLLIFTNYQHEDLDGGDFYEIDLTELEEKGLIFFDAHKACLCLLYAMYQLNETPEYFFHILNNTNFRYIKLSDLTKVGSERIKDFDAFKSQWGKFLANTLESSAEKRLSEVLDEKLLQENIEAICQNHPKVILEFLENQEENKIKEIGPKAYPFIKDKDIKSKVIVKLIEVSEEKNASLVYEAFYLSPKEENLLRIIYYDFYNQNKIEKIVNQTTNPYLLFFSGDFSQYYHQCQKTAKETSIKLWLLYYLDIESKLFAILSQKVQNCFSIKQEDTLITWKKRMIKKEKDKYLPWLKETIESTVKEVMDKKNRTLYEEMAFLIVALGSILEKFKQTTKQEYVKNYMDKYYSRKIFTTALKRNMEE